MNFKQMLSIILILCLIMTIFSTSAWAVESDSIEVTNTIQAEAPKEFPKPINTITPEHCHSSKPIPYDNNGDSQPYLEIGIMIDGVLRSSGLDSVVPVTDYSTYYLRANYVDKNHKKTPVTLSCEWNSIVFSNNQYNDAAEYDYEYNYEPIGAGSVPVLSAVKLKTHYAGAKFSFTASYSTPEGILYSEPCVFEIKKLNNGKSDTLLEYAALSCAVYTEFGDGELNLSVANLISEEKLKDNKNFISQRHSSGATFNSFYSATIPNWNVIHAKKLHDGFYAALFQSTNGKKVLAFRGTEPWTSEHKATDILSDIALGTGSDTNQCHDALVYYDELVSKGYSNITLTGHSLGGGLANYVSDLRKVKSYTFNAPSTMVSAIVGDETLFAESFTGLDDGLKTDYTNSKDWVGNTGIGDNTSSTETGNLVLCFNRVLGGKIDKTSFVADQSSSNGKGIKVIAPYHFFQQLIAYDFSNNRISIIQNGSETNPTKCSFYYSGSGDIGGVKGDYILGSTDDDKLYYGSKGGYVFGGNGNDMIVSSDIANRSGKYIICGGNGNDEIISFGSADEQYLYFNGTSGYDDIFDCSGRDFIKLYNYDDSEISVKHGIPGTDTEFYAYIYAGSKLIAKIYTYGNGCYHIKNEKTGTVIETINRYIPSQIRSYQSRCPVDMLIYDSDNNLVCALSDKTEMDETYDYGRFCVYEQDGEYIKTAVLFKDGYTAKMCGTDNGIMKFSDIIINNNDTTVRTVENVPVEKGTMYTAAGNTESNIILLGDSDKKDVTFYAPESIQLDITETTLRYGENIVLNASVQPEKTLQGVTWHSSNTNIAAVDEYGTVTAVGTGSAAITAVSTFDSKITASCVINVSDEHISIDNGYISNVEESYFCTGSPITPNPVITLGKYTLTEGLDYIAAYENNVDAGTAVISITGIGYFEGTITRAFKILPQTVDQKVEQLVYECLNSGAKTEYEKALWFHDWLIHHADYDHFSVGDYSSNAYRPAGVLLNGLGVCQSYAMAYQLLLNAVGIENIYVLSTSMDHAWNIVKIDGIYTHIDCTWDDPNSGGLENHFYFGLGDDEMEQDHIWDTTKYPTCQRLPFRADESKLPVPFDLMKPVQGVEFTLQDADGNTITREDIESEGGNILMVFGRPGCMNTMALLRSLTDWHEVLNNHNVKVVVVMSDYYDYEYGFKDQVSEMSELVDFMCGYNFDAYEMWQFDQRVDLTTQYILPQIILQNSKGYAYYHSTGYVYEPEKLVATAIQELPDSEQVPYSPINFYSNQSDMKVLIQNKLKHRVASIKLCNPAISEFSKNDLTVALNFINNECKALYGAKCSWYSTFGNEIVIGLGYEDPFQIDVINADNTSCSVRIRNNQTQIAPQYIWYILAAYNNQEQMVSVKLYTPINQTETITLNYLEDACKVKLFLWEKQSLAPITDFKTITIQQ